MSIETNLRGRLRNTKLPLSHGLLPLFEAVVNSIHSLEDSGQPSEAGHITVEICRDGQRSLEFDSANTRGRAERSGAIVGFRVTDDGIGFNDANMTSFRTLDSDHKLKKGGRGVGRLLWLKAFSKVTVNSIFRDDTGTLKQRSFAFDADSGVNNEIHEDANAAPTSTAVHLAGFGKQYREACLKTASSIANMLFEHCLWYFVRHGGVPAIEIKDGDDSIKLHDLYDRYMVASAVTEPTSIKGQEFTLTHIKLRATTRLHAIALCAESRLVKVENLSGKIAGLYGRLKDETGDFIYMCYVGSPFLDERVRSERTEFEISESAQGLLADDDDISLSDIRNAVTEKASRHLAAYLLENKKHVRDRVDSFVSDQAPRYRPIMSRVAIDQLAIDPGISDKELELTLHKQLADIELRLLSDGHDLMKPLQEEKYEEYQRRLHDYLRTAEDIKKSDLANYVFHRKVILDLLAKAIEKDAIGKYAREELIHNLIMPMGVDSNQVKSMDCNLWLLDERLAFHNYLASDKTLTSMPITGSNDTKEPDILALNVFDNPILVSEGTSLPMASIVVVEIKRPMRNDAAQGEEKDPIEQALGYLDRVREGGVTTASGRPIPGAENIPGFCYVLCDITPTIEKRCKYHDAIRSSDGLSYFFYNKAFKAYVEVTSFDGLLNAARRRNRAFFDQLGLPTN